MNKISIIIPVLNEEESIGKLLTHLTENSTKKNIAEIIVVDGGSNDNTKEIIKRKILGRAESKPDAKDLSTPLEEKEIVLLNSEKGRAKQMNSGAKKATGNILYFLHADSFPPKDFDRHIISQINKGNPAGCFKMKFDHSHWWLRLTSWFTKFSWRICRGGDQSQFITTDLFKELDMFDENFTIYEDNDLINKLYVRNQFVVIQECITTSARRYQDNGVWKLQYHFLTIYLKKWLGASADELYSYYRKNIV